MVSAHAHNGNWPAKLIALLAGSAENDQKKRLRTLEITPKNTLQKFTFNLAPV